MTGKSSRGILVPVAVSTRKKKLQTPDKIRTALVTLLLVAIAAISSMVLLIIKETPKELAEKSVAEQTEKVTKNEQPAPPIENPEKEGSTASQKTVPETEKPRTSQSIKSEKEVTTEPAGGVIEQLPRPKPIHKGTVAFVIDDAGNNLTQLELFLSFPGPLTIAVLPGLPYSAEAARRIRAAGKEVILHQPMEAIGGQNPGPGAIYSGMSSEEVVAILTKNVKELWPIVGMNNHEGSKITMNIEFMQTILSFCKEHGIYYLDSRTTADTVVPVVAHTIGFQIRERDVFIDNIQEKTAMIRSIQDGMEKAEKNGVAIMIGHVWSTELAQTLQELYPELIAQGFSLSTVSKIMMGKFEDEDTGD